MDNIEYYISESIKTGKWLDISYLNNQGEKTYYWISINDIDLKKKRLNVNIFNDKKSYNCLTADIWFERITSAKLLEFTTYDVNPKLIKKIETFKDDAAWLKYENFNNNILRYYMKCNELDSDPFQKDSCVIDGIDRDSLFDSDNLSLTDSQIKTVLKYIYHYDAKKMQSEKNDLVLSILSIEDNNKKYVVLYHKIFFNPYSKELRIDSNVRVNQTFLISGKKHSLTSYIDIDPNEFIDNITKRYDDYKTIYKELIRENLHYGEIINELPEFMILQRKIPVALEDTYKCIEKQFNKGDLSFPLKAFFKTANRFGNRRREPNIILYDRKVNIDQMRVIYNSMKYPITYVQGPPGTGKTQTILNVILSAFFNTKSILICSSNNKPVDGIIEKLSFSYKEENDVPFPYLRLGNKGEVNKALNRIKYLYELDIIGYAKDEQIRKIKRKNIEDNKKLVNALEEYENRKELEIKIDNAKRLIESLESEVNNKTNSNNIFQNILHNNIFSNYYNNRLYNNAKKQLEILEEKYSKTKVITNDDVLNLVVSVSEDELFKQYLYYESVRYIDKLHTQRYSELISICYIDDEEDRVSKFNNWCTLDVNMKLLESSFPVIMTTNISSSRLGTADHKFDLVIMDEAGQCNCATALLPIARAKNLLLVGDSNQLKPVILLEKCINEYLKEEFEVSDDYDYTKYSILELMRQHDNISKDIMLTYHYRCGKKIIDFSNKRFYNNKLNLNYLAKDGILSLIDVKNMNSKVRNQNYEEAAAIVDYVKRNNLRDTAIITPFVNQQQLINKLLEANDIHNVTCGTIHSVQGAEKDTIIISSSISPKTSKRTFEWLKNNSEITNVAVTRAKNNLIIVSDTQALEALSTDKKDDLYNLVNYVKNNGEIELTPNESKIIQIGHSNGSSNEDVFFKTISHFCTVNKKFQAKRNVKMSTLFYNDPVLSKSNLEFDIVLYTIKNTRITPTIIIELQGGEHCGNYEREKCDTIKKKVCSDKGITLLEIPNSFVKSYDTIKEIILSSCGEEIEQMELF